MTSLIARIEDAHRAIRPHVLRTPLDRSAKLSAALGCEVLLKLDHLQPTGSFKLRGATNKIRLVAQEGVHRRVLTASTGNHGRAVAYASTRFAIDATVYMSADTQPENVSTIEALGAKVQLVEGSALDAELAARRESERQNIPYVAPYNDMDTMAGQGTIGLEIAEQTDRLDAAFICVGGGGLMAGAGTALKDRFPKADVVGVSPQASRCMLDSLEAGQIVATPEYETLSDHSTGAVEPGSVTFPVCQAVIDRTAAVSEIEIARAMHRIARDEKWIIEGAAGVALAGLVQLADRYRGGTVAVVLCGRNVEFETYMRAMAMASA
ncbi:serine/threonine dehydratase [Nostoc sp. 3335mG]|nr:serine/threonine dehydratase [Nostoc sp. 3335mG]